ncbi:MAG: hypothetical protein H5T65_04710 [Chloroflexi bacterium]|nr:hypothetical protein [Chloroflexota bacterium]
MIFAAYLAEGSATAWREAVARHARWLGLAVRAGAIPLADGRAFHFTWLGPASAPDGEPNRSADDTPVILSASGSMAPAPEARTPGDMVRLLGDMRLPAAIRIGVVPAAGEAVAAVPPAAVEQLYFARVGGGCALSNDLRLMARLASSDLDEAGVLGLLRYGLTPAPLTLFRNVRRVPVGHLARIAPAVEPALTRFAVLGDPSHREAGAADPEAYIRETLDDILRRVPPSPVVYFSGGVDSALIAARLTALGRNDAILLNYAFGADDEKARLSGRIARYLGLRLEQMSWNSAEIPAVMGRLGRDYPFPFSDTALIPGNALAHAAVSLAGASRTTLHGVGAGALFGQRLHIRRLWRPLGWMPTFARRVLAWPYGALGLWRRESGLERLFSALRRSAYAPIVHAMMTEHPMDGIAYTLSPGVRRRLDATVREYVEPLSAGRDYDLLTSVIHQMYFTSREFSAIVLGPQMAAGVESVAPFMEPLMMQRGFALTWDEKRPHGVPKGLLRNLLARSLPPELVPAGGSFLAPQAEIYAHPAMRALIHDVVLAPDNPLLGFCRPRTVAEMLARLESGRTLAADARKFAWTLVFTSVWLRQVRSQI